MAIARGRLAILLTRGRGNETTGGRWVAGGIFFQRGRGVSWAGRYGGIVALAFLIVSALLPMTTRAQEWAPPQTVFVPRTGHTTDGLFLQVWQEQRGLIGDPVSEELRTKTGLGTDPDTEQVVQYYENSALVYLPERAAGEQVQTLDLGREALKRALAARPPTALVAAAERTACGSSAGDDCQSFAATGHTLRQGFRTYWEKVEGERWLGAPLTEAYRASDGSWIQYFERAVLRADGSHGIEAMPIGMAAAKRLTIDTSRILRPGTVPLYASTLFVAPSAPAPAAEAEPAPDAALIPAVDSEPGVASDVASEPEPAVAADPAVASDPEVAAEPDIATEADVATEPDVAADNATAADPGLEPDAAVEPVAVATSSDFGPGPQQGGYKEVVVSISAETMWAYEGGELVNSSLVSTGTAETPETTTPIGSHSILTKLDSQTMEGTISGQYYRVPDVPYVMYFDNLGNALHGTYWHSNFGTPMSHGCINLPMDVAAWMYDWAPVGTAVTVIP